MIYLLLVFLCFNHSGLSYEQFVSSIFGLVFLEGSWRYQIALGNWLYMYYPDSWLRKIWWSMDEAIGIKYKIIKKYD